MNVPRNVVWFEVLLYLSLMLDAVSVAFQDRTPTANMTPQMIKLKNAGAESILNYGLVRENTNRPPMALPPGKYWRAIVSLITATRGWAN